MNPILLLRLEGAAAAAIAAGVYFHRGHSGAIFAWLFFVPDLSLLGYLGGSRVGAVVYNLGHSYLSAALLGASGWATGVDGLIAGALVWAAHIGFDRVLGYGLKQPTGFADTHLGRIGRKRGPASESAS